MGSLPDLCRVILGAVELGVTLAGSTGASGGAGEGGEALSFLASPGSGPSSLLLQPEQIPAAAIPIPARSKPDKKLRRLWRDWSWVERAFIMDAPVDLVRPLSL
jgi:hypothetical protein